MKPFFKTTLLAIAVQALLAGVTLLIFFLFPLPKETGLIGWGRIYSPTIILVMILFMLFSFSRNLGIALVLGFLLGALLYGATFSFILNSYRKYKRKT
jgi:hypothetical protein